MRLAAFISSLLFLFAAKSFAYVGKWHSFTNKERVTSLISHGGYIYAGTQGGIRRIDPVTLAEKDYDNLDGLLDCWITGLAESDDGTLWAVARDGYVYALSNDRWEAYGRSYAAQKWVMNDRAALTAGQYLFLGSEKGLTLFDLDQKVSQANITRFDTLNGSPVFSLLRRADTLYVGTADGVYKAGVDFSNPVNPVNPAARYGNLADSRIWKRVNLSIIDSSTMQLRRYEFMAFIGDSLATYGPGTLLQSPIHVEAFGEKPVQIGSSTFSSMFAVTAVNLDGKVFLGGRNGIFVSANAASATPTLSSISRPSLVPSDTIWNITANGGKLWGQSVNGLYSLSASSGDSLSFNAFYIVGGPRLITTEFLYRNLSNLKADANGDVYAGLWGGSLVRVRNEVEQAWSTTTPVNTCIQPTSPSWYPVYALNPPFKNHVFFSLFKGENVYTHRLIHLNTATEQISCPDTMAVGGYPHAIRMFSDSLLGIASDLGVGFYKVREAFNSILLTPVGLSSSAGLWTGEGSANETWGLATDAMGRPWALMADQLFYVEKDTLDSAMIRPGSVKQRLQAAEGFTGKECYHLDGDPVGSLWAACSNGLYHIQPGPSGIGKVERYGLDQGLLSLTINDLSVDPSNGQVWIATDRGISMLESASQPPVKTLSSVQVYPNPFRPGRPT